MCWKFTPMSPHFSDSEITLRSQFDSESLKCGLIGVNFHHSGHEWRESFSTIAFSVPTMPGSQIGFRDF